MPHNHRCHLVLCCLTSKSHCRVVSVKFSPNPIPAQKMTNLQNTVRHLIIIVLSLFSLLIIRACLVICCLLSSRHFGTFSEEFSLNPLTVKMSLNSVTNQKICNLEKKIYRSLNLRFDLVFWCFAS